MGRARWQSAHHFVPNGLHLLARVAAGVELRLHQQRRQLLHLVLVPQDEAVERPQRRGRLPRLAAPAGGLYVAVVLRWVVPLAAVLCELRRKRSF